MVVQWTSDLFTAWPGSSEEEMARQGFATSPQDRSLGAARVDGVSLTAVPGF